jgi:hypothetical protein
MNRFLAITVALTVAFAGCATEEPPPVEPPVANPVDVGLTEGNPSNLVPPPAPGERDRRRMDIDQLDAAIKQVTGGLYWRVGATNQFTALSATLGKPDFQNSTNEDLAPSLLFQKFLGDAASSVCGELAAVDPQREESARTLIAHASATDTIESNPDAVEANLVGLMLRYHGRTTEAGSEELNAWRWLFESATHVSNDPIAGWRAVCVGLITHPDFYTY